MSDAENAPATTSLPNTIARAQVHLHALKGRVSGEHAVTHAHLGWLLEVVYTLQRKNERLEGQLAARTS